MKIKFIARLLLILLVFNIVVVVAEDSIPSVLGIDKAFGSSIYGSIAFGRLNSMGFSVKEYGILYSTTNPNPVLNGEGVRKYVSKNSANDAGQYGIELIDPQRILGSSYYARPYAIFEVNGVNTVVYSEVSTHIDLNEIANIDQSDGGSLSWEDATTTYSSSGLDWPYRPYNNLKSVQNPPDFSWPLMPDAISYDLKICSDSQLENIVYEKREIPVNYYNFPYEFNRGTYYWSVRYKTSEGYSVWSEARRFILLESAETFLVDDINTMLSKVPLTHPKLVVDESNIDEFRSYSTGISKPYYDSAKQTADRLLNEGLEILPDDPKATDNYKQMTSEMLGYIEKSALVYIITNDPAYAYISKQALLKLCDWDYTTNNGGTSYQNDDQVFRQVLMSASVSYDWLHNQLLPEEKEKILGMIRGRMIIFENPQVGLMDNVSKLPLTPYMSHGWTAVEYLLTACFATYNEIPESEEFIRKYLPLFININPPWGGEDGGWGQGMHYAKASFASNQYLKYSLRKYNIINLYNKPFYKNAIDYYLYNMGKYTGAEFGDGDNWASETYAGYNLFVMSNLIGSSYAKWFLNYLNLGSVAPLDYYYIKAEGQTIAEEPQIPDSKYFEDIGWVVSHSDLFDYENRISLYFKSSPYGSFNHSHADQNSFIIQGYGKRLAIDSGYYDYYFSEHHSNYTKQTFAHNAITYNNGKGQGVNLKSANGKIVNYLYHPQMDLMSGDALNAYNINQQTRNYEHIFDKVKRHIIYLKPDNFVIIDDLKTYNHNEKTFEWWLNAYSDITAAGNTATIRQDDAQLDAKIHYPLNVTPYFSNTFSGPDGVVSNPTGSYQNKQVHKRVWFKTEPTSETKIISTINVHRQNELTQNILTSVYNSFVRLKYADGTKVYIKTDDSDMIDADEYCFDGTALAVKGDTILLLDGTYLKKEGKLLAASDKPVSLVFGENTLSISCEQDSNIDIPSDYVELNYDNELIKCEHDGLFLRIKALSGHYSFEVDTSKFKAFGGFDNYQELNIPISKYIIE